MRETTRKEGRNTYIWSKYSLGTEKAHRSADAFSLHLPDNSCSQATDKSILLFWGREPFTEVSVAELGELIGLSRQTAGDNVIALAERGALARREQTEVVEGRYGRKVYKTRVSVALTMFTDQPAILKPLAPHNHGGKREKKCPHCKSKDLLLCKQLWCACCKREIDSTVEPVNDDRTVDEFVDDVLRRDHERGKL